MRAVATEGSYTLREYHVRAFGTNYANCWDMRLDYASHSLLMKEMNLLEGRYESLDEMLALGPPRKNLPLRGLLAKVKANESASQTNSP
jgi:hypothetical protein